MNNRETNLILAEKILGYTKSLNPYKYDSSITHNCPQGGYYSIPNFEEELEVWKLIESLKENFKIVISIESDEYLVKILSYTQCFVGKGYSIQEATITACLELVNKGKYDRLKSP